jgi:hypothetical protein
MRKTIGTVVLAGIAGVVLFSMLGWTGFMGGFGLPFQTRTVDRSQPPLLQSLEDIGEYRAASANFQEVVDIERDTRFVPGFVLGRRTVMVVYGSVDSGVDFSALPSDAVAVSGDGESVTITLPAIRLYPPTIDPERSTTAGASRGLIDRIGSVLGDGAGDERELLARGSARIGEAAESDAELKSRGEENIRAMLTKLFEGAGFERVEVVFLPTPAE